ncbi:general stress protein [Virgibacillus sp. W0430]|uniref:general stress protein n=1 Tax=Virgibacillus sp. W0430 TaxID=3391580 RepID=UPI003F446F3C
MRPFVMEYTNDENLQRDVQALQNRGVNKDDIYLLSHDDDRTDRVASNANASKIGLKEMDFTDALKNVFNKKGDELRTKLQDIGFSRQESETLEEDLDEGKILLIVTNHDNPERYLM